MTTLNITMRPKTFEDVIGLETEVKAIRAQITRSVPRAFCLTGPFGCGKTTLAYLIAREIQGGAEPVIQEVNAANVTGIDSIRKLVESSYYNPFSGKYNVIILDEAHKLSKPAQEALLKEFESPNSPTVWIICTTDPEKLVEGLRAGRCFTISLRELNSADRRKLISKAAVRLFRKKDYEDFLEAADKFNLSNPREVLMSFEAYHAGIPANEAVGAMRFENLPEYLDICMGVVFGSWFESYILFTKKYSPVADQLKALDTKLKKQTKATEEIQDEDVRGRPDVAQSLLAITAGILKGQLFKKANAKLAADSLFILAHCKGDYGLEFATVLGGLLRVNYKMKGLGDGR